MQIFLQFYNFNFSSKSKFRNRFFINHITFNELSNTIFNVNFCKISTQKMSKSNKIDLDTLF